MRRLDTRSTEWIYTIIDNCYGSGSTFLTSSRLPGDRIAVFLNSLTLEAACRTFCVPYVLLPQQTPPGGV